jgi:hypothetical protein
MPSWNAHHGLMRSTRGAACAMWNSTRQKTRCLSQAPGNIAGASSPA